MPTYAGAQPSAGSEPPPHGSFLGLHHTIETALQSHPIVQEGNASLEASSARVDQVKSLYYPQVYANADGAAGARRLKPPLATPARAPLPPNPHPHNAGGPCCPANYYFGHHPQLLPSS